MKIFFKILALTLSLLLLVSCNNGGDHMNPNENEGGNSTPKKPDPVLTKVINPIDIDQAFDSFESENGMPYRLYYPPNYSEEYAYPVILFLHGAGERGTDNVAPLVHVLQDWFNDTENPIYQSIVIVPQCPEGEQWVNTPWENGSYDSDAVGESNAIKEALAILEDTCNTYSVNRDRIYAMGLSMGGYGTWNLLMNHSDIFAAGIPICGGADPSKADILKDIPIHAFHGAIDSVVPVEATDEVVAAIQAAGGTKIYYDRVDGKDHNVWDYAAACWEVNFWLFDQRKPSK